MKKTTLLLSHLSARAACLWAALGLLAALEFGLHAAGAAVTEAWVHRYSNVVTNANDHASKVVRDAAGDIIVTGTTDDGVTWLDMLTIKYSGADGTVIWQQRYNGPDNRSDYASAVAVDGSGNVVVTGISYNVNFTNPDYYTAKYAAADGALLWGKRGPGGGASALALDGRDNVVVTGSSGGDAYTAKYAAADGTLIWEKRYNGPGNSSDGARAVAVDGGGNVVVTGYSFGGRGADYYTAKYASADGALLWEKHYNGPANYNDSANAVAVDASGNVVVTGSSGNGPPNYYGDYYTAKYAAADGALLWEERYNGPANNNDWASAVAVDGDGNVVVTGSSNDGTNDDYYTAKYAAANGALLWEKRYHGPANGDDGAKAVTVDASGNVVVTGSSHGCSGPDYYTAKYAAADGALLWEKRYDGGDDITEAVAEVVDGSGNVVVTGSSHGDYYTAKYAAADGALLWEKRYNGPANLPANAYANAIVVDGSGNVVVTGGSYTGSGTSYDYYTAKYAAADGVLLWEKRHNGGRNGGQAMAVDGSDNVVVTGTSDGGYYTAKYAAVDGALLWERRYNAGDGQAQAVAVDRQRQCRGHGGDWIGQRYWLLP